MWWPPMLPEAGFFALLFEIGRRRRSRSLSSFSSPSSASCLKSNGTPIPLRPRPHALPWASGLRRFIFSLYRLLLVEWEHSTSKTIGLGVGGTGLQTIRALRRQIVEKKGSLSALPNIGFLYIDTEDSEVNPNPDNLKRWQVLTRPCLRPSSMLRCLPTAPAGLRQGLVRKKGAPGAGRDVPCA